MVLPADVEVLQEPIPELEVAPATNQDVYAAQLAQSKSKRVESAQELLKKAAADGKVKKLINKPPRKGKGKGRGKGKGGAPDALDAPGAPADPEAPPAHVPHPSTDSPAQPPVDPGVEPEARPDTDAPVDDLASKWQAKDSKFQ